MAGHTLQTLLIALGFDVSGLRSGGQVAKAELAGVGAAARQMGADAAPANATILSLGTSAETTAAALASLRSSLATTSAVTGPLVTTQQAAAQSMMATSAAAGPLVAGVRSAQGALAAAAPAANLAAAGFRTYASTAGFAGNAAAMAGAAAGGAVPPIRNAGNAAAASAGGLNASAAAALRAALAYNQAGSAAFSLANRSSFMSRVLSMAFAFGGGVAVTTVFGFLASAVVGFNSRLEQAHIAFGTLLGDAGKADVFIKKMEDFANVTPFDFSSLEDAVQRLLAMGFAAEDVLPVLRTVGDAVAALGGNKEKLDRVTLALGQMLTAGRVNAQDMRQLTEAGIPAWQMLADAMGKSVAETRKMAEEGTISSIQAIDILVHGMDERFGGMMARQARTAQGAFSTIRDAALQIISVAVQPLFAAVSNGMIMLADFLINGGAKYVIPVIQAIALAIGLLLIPKIFGAVAAVEALSVSLLGVQIALGPLIGGLAVLGFAWQENFGGMRDILGPIAGAVASLVEPVVRLLVASGLLQPVIAVLITLIGFRLVGALAAAVIQMGAMAYMTFVLDRAFVGLTVSSGAATVSVSLLSRAMAPLMVLVGGAAGVIALWAAIIIFVATHVEELRRGILALAFVFIGAVKMMLDAASNLPGVGAFFKDLSDNLKGTQDDLTLTINQIGAGLDAKAKEMDGGPDVDPLENLMANFKNGTQQLLSGADDMVEKFGTTIGGVRAASEVAGADAMTDFAKGIRDHQQAPIDALVALRLTMATALSSTEEIALLVGMLADQGLVNGLNSGNPAVLAAAEALKKTITDRLDELTGGAYSAGLQITANLSAGVAALDEHERRSTADTRLLAGAWNNQFKPSVDASTAAMKKLNAELAKTANAEALGALHSAFSDIRQQAHQFFESAHRDNLQLIDDAVRQKNAILDAKAALNQAPVTAAQEALDFQRKQIEEWRLRQAVANASDPEAYRDAVLALQDFLAQSHIDAMQAQVDAAGEVIDAQKEANNTQADAERAAEDERYFQQVAAFDRDMQLLEDSLANQEIAWADGEAAIIALLAGYGIDFGTVGATLGDTFVANLKDSLADAKAALDELMAATVAASTAMQPTLAQIGQIIGGAGGGYTSYPSTTTSGVGNYSGGSSYGGGGAGGEIYTTPYGTYSFATGAWEILQDNLMARLHKGEMVVPADVAGPLREAMKARGGSGPGVGNSGFLMHASDMAKERVGAHVPTQGGGTLIFQVGSEKLVEMADQGLSVHSDIYGERRVTQSSQR